MTSDEAGVRPFKPPFTEDALHQLQHSRFAKKIVANATWAVTVFGEWRANRNRLCLEQPGSNLLYMYIDK